jgi:hypothetical protein
MKYWIPLIGLYFSAKESKEFFGLVVLANIAYIILTGFTYWFLNLPIFTI